jgi:hypothetical protein
MKNIKTYEGFKNWFSKKPVNISIHEDQIDSFLDDLKDVSFKNYKTIEKTKNAIHQSQ